MQSYTDESGQKWYLYTIDIELNGETVVLAHQKQWDPYEFDLLIAKRSALLRQFKTEYETVKSSIPSIVMRDELRNMSVKRRNAALLSNYESSQLNDAAYHDYVEKTRLYSDIKLFLESEGFAKPQTTEYRF